jgi:hypothetical protein
MSYRAPPAPGQYDWRLLAASAHGSDSPRVDGILEPQVDVNAVLRLARRGLDAPAIAERLQVSVLDIESVLRRFATARSWESLRSRI